MNASTIQENAGADNVAKKALKSIFAVAENYPDFKVNQNFLMLQEELVGIENKIAYARQRYNRTVLDLNNAIQQFPTNMIAQSFKFETREFFEGQSDKVRDVPNVKMYDGEVIMDPIYDNIAANKRWTYLFFSFYGVIILLIGYAIGVYIDFPIYGLVVAFAIFATVLLLSYYRGQNIVTSISGAEEVSKSEEPYLYNIVEALSIGAGIPTPKLYMINTDVPNAFAAGRNPKNASITVTTGLMEQRPALSLKGYSS